MEYLSKRLGEVEVVQSTNNVTTSLTATTNDPGESQRVQALIQNRGQASLIANPLTLLFDQGSTGQSATTTSSSNEQVQKVPLMLPDEIERFFRREAMNQLVSVKGMPPFILDRETYYEGSMFFGLYEPDRKPRWRLTDTAERKRQNLQQREVFADQTATAARSFVAQTQKAVENAKNRKMRA